MLGDHLATRTQTCQVCGEDALHPAPFWGSSGQTISSRLACETCGAHQTALVREDWDREGLTRNLPQHSAAGQASTLRAGSDAPHVDP